MYPSVYPSFYFPLEICPFPCLFVCLSSCGLSIYLAVYLQPTAASASTQQSPWHHRWHPHCQDMGPPKRLLTNSRDMWKCNWDTVKKQSKSARPAQCLKLDNIVYAKILRDFPYFRSWQEQKRSNSARLPYFFDGDNIKNDTILQDFLQ